MILPALWFGVVVAMAPKVVVVRLEPTAPIEREALEAVRTGLTGVEPNEVRLERGVDTPERLRALLKDTRAVIWFEAGAGALEAHVLGDDGRERTRTLPWDGGDETAAVTENAASVVRSLVQALLAKPAVTPVPTIEAPAPPPPPPAPPTAPAAPAVERFTLSGGYVGSTVGSGFGWQHGVRLDGLVQAWRRLMVGLEGSVFFDAEASWALGRFSLGRQTGALTAGVLLSSGRVELVLLAGGGVEHLRRQVLEVQGGTATAPRSVIWPTLQGQALATVRLGAFGLRASVGVRTSFRALEFRADPDDGLAGTVAAARLEAGLAGLWRF